MNILHMKYALEVARLGSLNKAAESLIIAQPNISRSIKELEADLGIKLFNRSAKGMVLTPEGEEFIVYAKGILEQIDAVEQLYRHGAPIKQKLSVSALGSPYISSAFAQLSKMVGRDGSALSLLEGDTNQTIGRVTARECTLGIIRYVTSQDRAYKELLEEKGLTFEVLAESSATLVMNKNHPLAKHESIKLSDLSAYSEIICSEAALSAVPAGKAEGEELTGSVTRRILICDRATRLEFLAENTDSFAWMPPIPEKILGRYGLVQRSSSDLSRVYKDLLIYREDYRFSSLDERFITALCEAKRRYF